jgi:hypothetical protein
MQGLIHKLHFSHSRGQRQVSGSDPGGGEPIDAGQHNLRRCCQKWTRPSRAKQLTLTFSIADKNASEYFVQVNMIPAVPYLFPSGKFQQPVSGGRDESARRTRSMSSLGSWVSFSRQRRHFVDSAPICANYIFTIDVSTKAVSGLRKNKPSGQSVPSHCNTLDKELRLSLLAGFNVSQSLKDEALPWFGHLAVSPFKLLRSAP